MQAAVVGCKWLDTIRNGRITKKGLVSSVRLLLAFIVVYCTDALPTRLSRKVHTLYIVDKRVLEFGRERAYVGDNERRERKRRKVILL